MAGFNGAIEVVIQAHRGLEQRANVLHFAPGAEPVTMGAVQAAADLVFAWVEDFYFSTACNEIIFDQVKARDMTPNSAIEVVKPFTNVVGGQNGGGGPANATIVVSLHTAVGGRSGRGRVYTFDPLRGAFNDATQTWAPTEVALRQTVFQQLLTDSQNNNNCKWCVLSKTKQILAEVTSVKAHDYVGTQDDRLPGHRRHKTHRIVP